LVHLRNGYLEDVTQQNRMESPTRRAMSSRILPFLQNTWYVAFWSGDLVPGAMLHRRIANVPILFFRREDGSVAALMDRCSHRFAPLHRGKLLSGDRVQCGYHGLEFGADGRCVLNPYGTGNIPPAAHLRVFPVAEKHRLLWVWLGTNAADPGLIPDFSVLSTTAPEHVAKLDYIRINANIELVTNNLLDLSHTAFLHEGVHSNPDHVGAEIVVEETTDTVTVSRISPDVTIPGLMKLLVPHEMPRVEKWNRVTWFAPGNLLLQSGVTKPGDGREVGTGIYGIHFLTPETDRTTHYHFTSARWNVQTKPAANDHIMRQLSELRRYAFEYQDGPMIETQQQLVDEAGDDERPVLLAIDSGPVKYRRILTRLLEAEGALAAQALVPAG
jgi:phenylpropionate dioxygenase-like ring-hydroxylating dioxygenase large terminal subunit